MYELLLRRNNQKLFRVIRTYITDISEIEDIMQDVYLKAYEKLYQFKHKASFSTWLIRIGINETLRRLKSKRKIYHLIEKSTSFESNNILEMPDNAQLNPEKRIIRQEAQLLLENAIDSLDLNYRTVYVLKEIEEMSLLEIAATLDITVSNTKVRIHRAKAMLKEKLYELSIDKNVFEYGFSRCDKLTKIVMNQIN